MRRGGGGGEAAVVQGDEVIALQPSGLDAEAREVAHDLARTQIESLGDGVEAGTRCRSVARPASGGQHSAQRTADEGARTWRSRVGRRGERARTGVERDVRRDDEVEVALQQGVAPREMPHEHGVIRREATQRGSRSRNPATPATRARAATTASPIRSMAMGWCWMAAF
jgi:hypothetical protein